jgi:hypothetical protein
VTAFALPQTESRSVPAMIKRRLDMGTSGGGLCDDTRKAGLANKQALGDKIQLRTLK